MKSRHQGSLPKGMGLKILIVLFWGKRLSDKQGKPKPARVRHERNTFHFTTAFEQQHFMKISVHLACCPARGQPTIKTLIVPLPWLSMGKTHCVIWLEMNNGAWMCGLSFCITVVERKKRCKQLVMSEVKEGNENVKSARKLLNGTKCLGGEFVCPCAACLPQSITRKDEPPQEEWMS